MKPFLTRTLLLLLLLLPMTACDDPWDRVQGEPGEDILEPGSSQPHDEVLPGGEESHEGDEH